MKEASKWFHARKALGMTEGSFVRMVLGVLFATVGNSIPAVFWCVYHILADPKVYQAKQTEVDSVVKEKQDESSAFSLEELDKMVLLKSAFQETLRLYMGSFTARDATQDFVFDPKKKGQSKYLIEKGTRVMGFMATLYHDPEVFENPKEYQYDRFAPNENGKPPVFTKNGKRIAEPVRVFGGGVHLCPGRRFISYETRAFLAVLLTRFDMRLVDDKEGPPLIKYDMQGVGVSHPDRDPRLEIRARSSSI